MEVSSAPVADTSTNNHGDAAWTDAQRQQAKQSIEWLCKNDDVSSSNDSSLTVFEDIWEAWELLVSDQGTASKKTRKQIIDTNLLHSLLLEWRRALGDNDTSQGNIISPKDMLSKIQGWGNKGTLQMTGEAYNIILSGELVANARKISTEHAEWAHSVLQEMLQTPRVDVTIVAFATALQFWVSCLEEDKAALHHVQLLEHERRRLEGINNRVRANVVYSSTLMDAYAKAGRPQECQALWDEWWSQCLLETSEREPPNIHSASILINAWKNKPDRAEAVLRELEERFRHGQMAEPPNVVVYTAVLNAWARSSRPNAALHAEAVLQDMVQRGHDGPNVVSYTAVINAYAKVPAFSKAKSLMKTMIQAGVAPNTGTFNAVLSSARNESLDEAFDILHSMTQLSGAHGWDCEPDAISFTIVLQQCVKHKDVGGALKTWNLMLQGSHRPDVLSMNTILSLLAREGMASQAEAIFTQGQEHLVTPTIITYSNLLNAWANCPSNAVKSANRAEELIDIMRKQGIVPNIVSYSVLCKCYARARMAQQAVETWERVQSERTIRMNTTFCNQVLHAIASDVSSTALLNSAKVIIETMMLDGIATSQVTWSAYLKIIYYSSSSEKEELSIEALRLMRENGLKPNEVVLRQVDGISRKVQSKR